MSNFHFGLFKTILKNVPSQTCGGSVGCSNCSRYTGNERVRGVQKMLENPNTSPMLRVYAQFAKCEHCDHYLREHTWYI